ncbi:MAG: Na+:solute symporter [Verrucomicrobiae bacterium]|nr:Na+:solute symporter [Verrucomicrobiae bacterium]
MQLETIDWIIIGAYFLAVVAVGLIVAKKAGTSSGEYFLGGRQMPWWLLGFSMVATTFSTDTPNLVTDIVRQNGVAGNWVWWAFLITGMVTVFLFAKLWRRSEVLTDMEFYELRYSGKSAAFLRGFRAIYLGVFFNMMIMGTVSLAAIKIGGVMLGLSPLQSILWAGLATVVFSSAGGFRGVVFTDCLLFVVAMVGSVAAACFAVGHTDIGSLSALFDHPAIADKISFLPPTDNGGAFSDQNLNLWMSAMIIPLVIQWWSVWYPGAEPGGGGYVAQRMLAAKDEKHATGAVLFFNFAHYGLRPWPWIIVALASLVVFPRLEDIQAAFPHLDPSTLGHDLAYPAMLTFLPSGWLGLVLASLVAAYMSTISTHLNWGSSYVVNDFYKRFINPEASEKQQVRVGRISTVLLMVASGWLALQLRNAKQAFDIMLMVGAGTGLIFMLRWYWWRINAFSELSAMIASFIFALALKKIDHGMPAWLEMITGIGLTTAVWLTATFLTAPTSAEKLKAFYQKTRPGGPGWNPVRATLEKLPPQESLAPQFLNVILGIATVYAFLFGIGKLVYGNWILGFVLIAVSGLCGAKVLKAKTR